jgi:hypothetical protein
MNCQNCPTRPVAYERLCAFCVSRRVEKKISRAFRNVLSKDDKRLLVINDGTAAGMVLEYMVKAVLKHTHHEIMVRKEVGEPADKVFVPVTRDFMLKHALTSVFSKGELPARDEVVLLLEGISTKECEILATAKNLTFKPAEDGSFSPLEKLENVIPGTKNALAKSIHSFQLD